MNYDNIPDARVRRKMMCRDLKICRECSKQDEKGNLVGPKLHTATMCWGCNDKAKRKARERYKESREIELKMRGAGA